jgi:hypothetical protein
MTNITMLTTSASPERILLAGKSYRVSDAFAAELLAEPAPPGPGEYPRPGPFATLARPGAKVEKLPSQPDPEDYGDDPDDDDGD